MQHALYALDAPGYNYLSSYNVVKLQMIPAISHEVNI